jgi:hypothetical protein
LRVPPPNIRVVYYISAELTPTSNSENITGSFT